MQTSFSNAQAKGLASFFFDVGKGLTLGGLGFAVVLPIELKIAILLLMTMLAFTCVQLALFLLKEMP